MESRHSSVGRVVSQTLEKSEMSGTRPGQGFFFLLFSILGTNTPGKKEDIFLVNVITWGERQECVLSSLSIYFTACPPVKKKRNGHLFAMYQSIIMRFVKLSQIQQTFGHICGRGS